MANLDPSMRIEKRFGFADALVELQPQARWSMQNDEYESITWYDAEHPQPSKEACLAKMREMQDEYDALKYQRDRMYAYPPIEVQLDIMYHGGLEAWQAVIDEIKAKYPKPTV